MTEWLGAYYPVGGWILLGVMGLGVGRVVNRVIHRWLLIRYPLIELITGLLTLWLAVLFPPGWTLLGMLLFSWCLLALAIVDINTLQLPDQLTQPLLWLGLLFNLITGEVDLADAVLGAVAGYLTLWLLYWGFRLITGREGIGHGDFKLLAAMGAWLGWAVLPQLLLLAALLGLIGVGVIGIRDHRVFHIPLPFGPPLALSGWLIMLDSMSPNGGLIPATMGMTVMSLSPLAGAEYLAHLPG